MNRKTFNKFVVREERQQSEICGNSEYFCCEKETEFYKECADIAIEILKRLASSEKAEKFISKVETRSVYGETGVRIGDDFERHQLEIFFVTGDEINDEIRIESNIYEKKRFYRVIGPESFWTCYNLDTLIEYLENMPKNKIPLVSKGKDRETELEEKIALQPTRHMKLKNMLKRINKGIQKKPHSRYISDMTSLSKEECRKRGYSFTRSLSFLREYSTAFTPVKYYSNSSYSEDGAEYTYFRIFFGYKRYKYIEIYHRKKVDKGDTGSFSHSWEYQTIFPVIRWNSVQSMS